MTKGVLVHHPDAIYHDIPSIQYQFPKQYLRRLSEMVGDWIIYYGRQGVGKNVPRGYFATARVQEIVRDPSKGELYLAMIEPKSYLSFGQFVPYFDGSRYLETAINTPSGRPNGGHVISAVRMLSDADFANIITLGCSGTDVTLPREDDLINTTEDNSQSTSDGLHEPQTMFVMDGPRDVISRLINKKVRSQQFRRSVLAAYKERCAVTGLKFINGGGRAEVQAAHIHPVEHGGPDDTRNGIALSGTAHWMFDRGLISLSNDFDILISRKVNNTEEVNRLINKDGKASVPERVSLQPHPRFLDWHRTFHGF